MSDHIDRILDVGNQHSEEEGTAPDEGSGTYDVSATDMLEPQEQQPFEGES